MGGYVRSSKLDPVKTYSAGLFDGLLIGGASATKVKAAPVDLLPHRYRNEQVDLERNVSTVNPLRKLNVREGQ